MKRTYESSTSVSGGGSSIAITLTVVFVILKVEGLIDWSWWMVFSPLLVGLAVVVVALIGFFIYLKHIMRKF